MTTETVRVYAALDDRVVVAERESDATGGEWVSRERLTGAALQSVAGSDARPDRAFAGTVDSGIHRTTDGGDSWERVAPGIEDRVTALAVSPHDPDVVWAGTEPSAVHRTTDGGDAWESLAPVTDLPSEPEWSFPPRPHTHHVRWIEPDPHDPDRLTVSIEAGALLRTDDGGDSWQDRPSGARRDNHTLATHPDRPGRVYAAAGDGYAQSADGGDTWVYPQDGLDHRYVWGLAVPDADPGTVVVSAASGARRIHSPTHAEAHVYRTTDADAAAEDPDAVRWERAMDGLPDPGTAVGSVLAPAGGDVLYALNDRGLYRSADAGRSWDRTPVTWADGDDRPTPSGLAVVGRPPRPE